MSAIAALTCDNEGGPGGVGSTSRGLTRLSDSAGRGLGVSLPSEEQWRPVVGYEGKYAVSSLGRVRSLGRGIFLTAQPARGGYLRVALTANGKTRHHSIHSLVCTAWHGPRPEGLECRHLNDIKADNRPENLAWGTHSENTFDAVRNGVHYLANRDACDKGHLYTPENIRWRRVSSSGRLSRKCRTCERAAENARRAKEKETWKSRPLGEPVMFTKTGKPIIHGRELSYTTYGCRCTPCRAARSVHEKAQREAREERRRVSALRAGGDR